MGYHVDAGFEEDKEQEMSPHPSVFEHQLFRSAAGIRSLPDLLYSTMEFNWTGLILWKTLGL